MAFRRPTTSDVISRLENLALRHQLTIYQRSDATARIQPVDRLFWAVAPLVRLAGCTDLGAAREDQCLATEALQGSLGAAEWEDEAGPPGDAAEHPATDPEDVEGESALGIIVAKSTVERCMIQERRPPSPTWRASCPWLRCDLGRLPSHAFPRPVWARDGGSEPQTPP